ncbi:MAG: hypothetical protein IBX52_06035 [Bacterioplanes sp.]|nr:hypothetical protein [Bacterioplanes sp.]
MLPLLSRHKNTLLSLLLITWLTATLIGLWWFQQQTIRPFVGQDDDMRFWRASDTAPLLLNVLGHLPNPRPQQVTLVHLWNPDCLCNQVSQRHFSGLVQQFDHEHLRVIILTPQTTSDATIHQFHRLNGDRYTVVRVSQDIDLPIPSSPGLALFNDQMQMSYYGAYGFGALCTLDDDAFFPNIIERMQAGPYGPFMNVAGRGCFCAWPTNASATPASDE